MRLFKALLITGLVDGWTQPSMKEVNRMINERSAEQWGRPVDTTRKLQSRLWSDCSPPDIPENALAPKCQRSSCMLKCAPGFVPVGRKRIACRKRGADFLWMKSFGECKSCADKNPTANSADVKATCKTNALGRKSCIMACPPGRPLVQFGLPRIKITCKCPKGSK